MSIWSIIASNPEEVTTAVTAILGFFGVKKWRSVVRDSTAAEVDKWASTAAGVVVLAIKTGRFNDHEQALDEALRHFQGYAAAMGVQVKPEHQHRALANINRILMRVGQEMVVEQARQLKLVVDAAMSRMEKLPWPK